jgi:hypothetical protein
MSARWRCRCRIGGTHPFPRDGRGHLVGISRSPANRCILDGGRRHDPVAVHHPVGLCAPGPICARPADPGASLDLSDGGRSVCPSGQPCGRPALRCPRPVARVPALLGRCVLPPRRLWPSRSITTSANPRYRPGETLQATLRITNSGVGHYFPTYVTPRAVVRFELIGKDGKSSPDTQKEAVIGRDVPLDLSRELFDTRIPPGETFTINYTEKVPRAGLTLRTTVTVEPTTSTQGSSRLTWLMAKWTKAARSFSKRSSAHRNRRSSSSSNRCL